MYQWNEALQYVTTEGAQGICPNGWHIPTFIDFNNLAEEVGDSLWRHTYNGGEKLKSIRNGGNNLSGFDALLGGEYYSINYGDPSFRWLGESVNFWSSSQYSNPNEGHYVLYLTKYDNDIKFFPNTTHEVSYVRCIRD